MAKALSFLSARVRLSKRRLKAGQQPSNSKLVVRHRPLNKQEHRMQRYREKNLEPHGKKISCCFSEDFGRFFLNNILHQPFICSKRTGPSHKPSCCLDSTYCYRELSSLPWKLKNCHKWRRLPQASLSPELWLNDLCSNNKHHLWDTVNLSWFSNAG